MALIAAGLLLACTFFIVSATPSRYELMGMRTNNCRKCRSLEECLSPPSGRCDYGDYNDGCGFVNCYRGPGEVCSHSKRCVEGLSCLCGKCTGCFIGNSDFPECYIHTAPCSNGNF